MLKEYTVHPGLHKEALTGLKKACSTLNPQSNGISPFDGYVCRDEEHQSENWEMA